MSVKKTAILRDALTEHQIVVRTTVSESYEEERVAAQIKRRGPKLEVIFPRQTGIYRPQEFGSLEEAVDYALGHIDE